jgi:hypothetical protein
MPDPVNVWEEHAGLPEGVAGDHTERGLGSKKGGVRWMERKAEYFKKAGRVVIVGGGALGIRESYVRFERVMLNSDGRVRYRLEGCVP